MSFKHRRRIAVIPVALTVGLGVSLSSTPSVAAENASHAAESASLKRTYTTNPAEFPFTVQRHAEYDIPWALTFLPNGDQLITERSGKLYWRNPESGTQTRVYGLPDVAVAGQGGLGDIKASPNFSKDGMVFLSWAEAGANNTSGAAVGKAKLVQRGDTAYLRGLRVIWRQTPKVTGSGHFAHRLAFSPDGKYLFITSGDRQKLSPAQDLNSTLGKVVRLTLNGRPAPGNPFSGKGRVASQIWSYGHRNPLGIDFDAGGKLWSSEMGPEGGDELNLIQRGGNYGWPKASNGSHYGGADIPDHRPGDGFIAPTTWWTPSVSPSSLMVYSGRAFPQWAGDAFVGGMSTKELVRVCLMGGQAKEVETFDWGKRVRDIEQAPDGTIWLLEEGPGALVQLTPK